MISNNVFTYMDETSIHPLLKCKLCSKPFVDPVSTQNGDRFCRRCIFQIVHPNVSNDLEKLSVNNEENSSKLQNLTPVTDKIVMEMLNSLLVRCVDCEEINIRRGDLEEHKKQFCTKATILCTAADIKCPWFGAREDLNDHLDECKFEPLRSVFEDIFNELADLKRQLLNIETQRKKPMDSDVE